MKAQVRQFDMLMFFNVSDQLLQNEGISDPIDIIEKTMRAEVLHAVDALDYAQQSFALDNFEVVTNFSFYFDYI